MPSAPPEPPSPITAETTGTGTWNHSMIADPIAEATPPSSAAAPGYAPGVSTSVTIGNPNLAAWRASLSAFRYPSGCIMPQLRATRSARLRPFWLPRKITVRPRHVPIPPTRAGSSPLSRSPCSSRKSGARRRR